MVILKTWAAADVWGVVERYWAEPETNFDEMLGMVFNFMKCTYRDLGELDDGRLATSG